MRRKANRRGRQPRKNVKPAAKAASSSSPTSSSSHKISKGSKVTKPTAKSPSKRTAKAPVTRSKTSSLPQTQADIDDPDSLYWAELLLDRATPEPIDWRHPEPGRRGHNASEEDERLHREDVPPPTLQQRQESAFGPWSEEFESGLRDFLYIWMKENVHQYPFTPPPDFLFSPEHIREISCTRFPCGKLFLQDYLTAHARNQFAQDIIVELIFWIQEEKRVMQHAYFDYDDTRKTRSTAFAWKHSYFHDA